MKVLVTGATGFLGSNFMSYLRNKNLEAISLEKSVLSHGSLSDLASEIKRSSPESLVHFAGTTMSQSISEQYQANILNATRLIDALNVAGLNQTTLMLIGTSAEYGNVTAQDLPLTEESPAKPYNFYGTSKLAQTQLGLAASKDRPIIMVRPFNVIGPGMRGHLAVQSFATQIAKIVKEGTEPVLRVGNLKSSRDFIDVTDCCEVMWRLLQNQKALGQVVNICSGHAVTMESIVIKLIEISGAKIDVQVDSSRMKKIDVPFHYGSTAKMESLVGKFPFTSLNDSLNRIYKAN